MVLCCELLNLYSHAISTVNGHASNSNSTSVNSQRGLSHPCLIICCTCDGYAVHSEGREATPAITSKGNLQVNTRDHSTVGEHSRPQYLSFLARGEGEQQRQGRGSQGPSRARPPRRVPLLGSHLDCNGDGLPSEVVICIQYEPLTILFSHTRLHSAFQPVYDRWCQYRDLQG